MNYSKQIEILLLWINTLLLCEGENSTDRNVIGSSVTGHVDNELLQADRNSIIMDKYTFTV